MRLLIVDDERDFAANLETLLRLKRPDWQITRAGSAEEAEPLLEEETFDVLLTDIRLPGRDGIDLLRQALALQPGIRVLVMTAFPSADLSSDALASGALRFLEKPIDCDELVATLERAAAAAGWRGQVAMLEIFDLAQLLAMAGRSAALAVRCGGEEGRLVFRKGQLVHASVGELEGEEAFYRIAEWQGGSFEELQRVGKKALPQNISMPTMNLLLEATRRRDEGRRQWEDVFPTAEVPPAPVPATMTEDTARQPTALLAEEVRMAIRDHLESLRQIDGFLGAAVFAPDGAPLENITAGKVDIATVGAFANNALLNAQKATDQMGVGRGNLVQIRAPQATVLMRCYNEATDFTVTGAGKAHFHLVAVLGAEGNAGMTVMMLDKIVGKIAEELR